MFKCLTGRNYWLLLGFAAANKKKTITKKSQNQNIFTFYSSKTPKQNQEILFHLCKALSEGGIISDYTKLLYSEAAVTPADGPLKRRVAVDRRPSNYEVYRRSDVHDVHVLR